MVRAGRRTSRAVVRRVAFALAATVAAAAVPDAVRSVADGVLPLALVASAAAVVLLVAAAVLLRVGAVHGERSDLAFVLVVLVPILATVLHVGTTGSLRQTIALTITLVVAGASGADRRLVAPLVLTGVAMWVAAAVAVGTPGPALREGAVRVVVSALVAFGVLEVRQRSERRLRDAVGSLRDHVAELDAAREVVAESERRFHGVFTHSPIAVSLSDEHGLFVEVNQALCELVDRPAAQLIGRSAADITHPEDNRRINARSEELISAARDGVFRTDIRYVRPDGSVRDALLSLKSVPGPQGENWTLAHVVDVTESRATERALRRSEANLQAVSSITRTVQEGLDPRPVVLAAMQELSGASHSTLIERLDADHLVLSAELGAPELAGTIIPLASTSATAHAWQTGATLYLADAARNPLTNPALLQLRGAASLLLEPVHERGEVVAVLCMAWDRVLTAVPEEARRSARMLADELGPALTAQRLREELEAMATTDPLTRVANRRGWDERVGLLVADSRRTGRPLTLALVDLDHFKSYNDSHGHTAGDALLRTFADSVGRTLREVDVFARWGGEEFVVALPDCHASAAAAVLERVRACVPDGQTCSVGYASWDGLETTAQCLSRADVALYRAKLDGRDRSLAA